MAAAEVYLEDCPAFRPAQAADDHPSFGLSLAWMFFSCVKRSISRRPSY
jgi:hypothetical protein